MAILERIPDPTRRLQDIPRRRVPRLEFGTEKPLLRAAFAGTIAIGNGNETEVTWGDWENSDPRFFTEEVTGSPPRLRKVGLLIPGEYSITWSLQLNGAFTKSDPIMLITFNDLTGEQLYPSVRVSHAFLGDSFGTSWLFPTLKRTFPDFRTDLDGGLSFGIVGRVLCKASQGATAGGTRDAIDGWLEVTFDGHSSEELAEP